LTYHVYNRVGRGEAPFKLEDEAERFWSLMHKVKKRDGLAVMAWCIMPNHYHLAVRTASVPLWRSIRSLQHAYTQGFNRRCKVLGPLWQARYKARPVEGTDSLLRLLAYIHLNPARVRMVDDPGEVPVERPSRAAGGTALAPPLSPRRLWRERRLCALDLHSKRTTKPNQIIRTGLRRRNAGLHTLTVKKLPHHICLDCEAVYEHLSTRPSPQFGFNRVQQNANYKT
jgi:REP element-mobilizing transposase RayT